jgi:Tol biopolymer transport system component
LTLAPGVRLGPYEILAPLGAGGMGEVYRAKDPRLGRDVAIKVLPSELSADPERRRRFEHEARSASALNHPNILTIYDIGSSGETTYIAMELVEGKTLRELVAPGPLPMKRLLELAVQIAEGLAKAHAAGIVHRDLKPENLMISKDGYLKILDFGLAKLTEPVVSGQSALPTAIAPPTQPGVVMGTAGYMSPEQASGLPVDFRSDQFALGAILYEMATGKHAFQRQTGAETLVAIIREEPEPLGQLAPKTPAPVRWIVEQLLAKDPEERYASTRDLARDLAKVRDHLSETSASGGLAAAEPTRPRRRGWLLPALAALVLGAAVGLLLRGVLATKADLPLRFQRLTYRRGTVFSARFTPDGQTIVYGAAWDGQPLDLFSTRVEGRESRSLGLPPADILSISSTGEMAISLGRHFIIGFETAGTLARVPLGGGAPRSILENVQDADWSPDGKELAVARYLGNRCRLEYPIGNVLFETAAWVSNVRVSPDGKLVAFLDHAQFGDNTAKLRVVDQKGRTRLTGPAAATGLAWSPRGDEVWTSPPLQATSLSGRTRSPWSLPGKLDGIHDIAPDGRILFSQASARREIIGGSAAGGGERNLTWLDWSFPTDISSDGQTVLFDEENSTPNGVYTRRFDGSGAVLIGDGGSFGLSPDGQWALAIPERGSEQLLLLPVGPGQPRALPKSNVSCQWVSFFPDGRRLLIGGHEPGRGVRLFIQDLPDGRPRAITPEGVAIRPQNPISPDGKRIAARGPDGRLAIYPVEPGEPRPVPGLTIDDQVARWSPDGRSLFVYNAVARPGSVELVDVQSGRRTPWKEVHPPDPAGVLQIEPFVISPDGGSYVYSYRRLLDELYLVTGLK